MYLTSRIVPRKQLISGVWPYKLAASPGLHRLNGFSIGNGLLLRVDRQLKPEPASKHQQVCSHGAEIIRLVMQALQEPERICAASETDITPSILAR